jgi:hypothetical protein
MLVENDATDDEDPVKLALAEEDLVAFFRGVDARQKRDLTALAQADATYGEDVARERREGARRERSDAS